jgi:hypothetical protein
MRWTAKDRLINVRLLVTKSRVHWGERREGKKASSPNEEYFPHEHSSTRVERGFASAMQRARPNRCGSAADCRDVAADAGTRARNQRSANRPCRAQTDQQSAGNHRDGCSDTGCAIESGERRIIRGLAHFHACAISRRFIGPDLAQRLRGPLLRSEFQ